MSEGKT